MLTPIPEYSTLQFSYDSAKRVLTSEASSLSRNHFFSIRNGIACMDIRSHVTGKSVRFVFLREVRDADDDIVEWVFKSTGLFSQITVHVLND